ncbi:MAG: phosphoethanolamine--lipid A transferase [Desulfobacteraceae bacterium]|jgi:lipid A ethanolaminephosphotransferase
MKSKSSKRPVEKKTGHKNNWEITSFWLIIFTSVFLVAFDNFTFFKKVTAIYPVSMSNIGFLASITVVLTSVIILLFSIFCLKYTAKPILITILLVSSLVSYFMNHYNVVIDYTMIQNTVETDIGEVFDLLNLKLFIYLVFAGILPSEIVYRLKIRYKSFKKELLSRVIIVISAILIILASALPVSDFYTSFLREHKSLRYYTNPTYYLFSIGKYIGKNLSSSEVVIKKIGTDAKIPEADIERELIILVVGEALRANRLSLNGYEQNTNPLLEKEDIINFSDMHSCGTTTSVSIPCMFSIFTRDEYSYGKAKSTHNVLDVLSNAGVNILWRDNNSSSKGVADRVPYEDYRDPKNNPVCDIECRDEGMLAGLEEYIESRKSGDILIVLHQMGNHGPAYYKRYPEVFEKFKPVCKTSELGECSREEISNAYDNAVLYTDYFLSKVIAFLKQYPHFESVMFYIGDHGESLGEKGVYLHGLPYFMAPEDQKHIPAIMWFGEGYEVDREKLKKEAAKAYSNEALAKM